MSRSQALLLAIAVSALFAAGCAHCDTCDDFPVPQNTGTLGSYTEVAPTLAPGQTVTSTPIEDGSTLAPLPTGTSPFQSDAVPAPSGTQGAPRPATDNAPARPAEPPISPPSPGTANPSSTPTALR